LGIYNEAIAIIPDAGLAAILQALKE